MSHLESNQDMGPATMIVRYSTPDMNSTYSATLVQSESVIHTYSTTDNPVPIYKYIYQSGFTHPIAGSQAGYFKPNNPGTYTFAIEATDAAGNRNTRNMTVRAIEPGTQPDGVDGPPQVDEIVPSDGAKEIMVTMPIIVTFNEPVQLFRLEYDPYTQNGQLFRNG